MKKINNIIWGIVLITIGVILGLNALEITNINIFFDGWWTLFIIIPSCIGLVNEKDKLGNIFGLFIGIALLLICQNIIDFALLWELIVPITLILIGLSLIFKNKETENIKKEVKALSNKKGNAKEYCSTFSSMNIKLDDTSVDKYEIDAIFGEIKAELNERKDKELLLKACSVFGNIILNIPEDTEVKLLSTPIFGSISDNRKNQSKEKKNIIYLNATAIFGGVEIK